MSGPTVIDGDQNLAYERAVRAARSDAAMRALVESTFLQDDPIEAYEAFRSSEHWARVRWLLCLRGVPAKARVMDFGGGRGLIAASLAADGCDATLCEINPSGVCGTAAARAVRAAVGVDFSIEERPVGELAERGAFDAVVCRSVLHHLTSLVATLRDTLHVLKPGGSFIAADEPTVRRLQDVEEVRRDHPFTQFGVWETAYRVEDYLAVLREAGFSDARVHFPVQWRAYRRHLRASTPLPIAAAAYSVYRAARFVTHPPGDVRAFTAQRPR